MTKISAAVWMLAAAGCAAVVPTSVLAAPDVSAMPPADAKCAPDKDLATICQDVPEDLIGIPGTDLLLSSSLDAGGGIYLVDTRARTSKRLWHPADGGKERFDAVTYAGCPGAPQGADRVRFHTHGLALRPGPKGTATVYAVHHGARETIEVFSMAMGGGKPALTWTGCIPAPTGSFMNSVVAAEQGSIIATKFFPGTAADIPNFVKGNADTPTGEAWQWRPRGGWSKLAGTEAPGPNGIALSRDGKWLFMSAWLQGTVVRIDRRPGQPKRDTIKLGFQTDNIRWGSDGLLYVAGQGYDGSSHVASVNPVTLKVTPLLGRKDTATLGQATVALPVRNEIWVGFIRTSRIGIFPRVKLPAMEVPPIVR